jgi:hypothetical protein
MNRLGKTLCIFLALFFAFAAFESINGLKLCFFPEPVGKNQLDGLTCEWPVSSNGRIFMLITSVLGILLAAWAWGGRQKARISLAALTFFIGFVQVVNEVWARFYFGYAPLSLEPALWVVAPFTIGVLLIYFSKPKHLPITS